MKSLGAFHSLIFALKRGFKRRPSPECCDSCYVFCLFPTQGPHAKTLLVLVSRQQHISFLLLNSVPFCAGGGEERQFICHGFQKRRLTLPAPPPLFHYTDSSLISHQGTRPPHEFGHCSPSGPRPARFYNSANDAKIFLSVINLINILIMTWR